MTPDPQPWLQPDPGSSTSYPDDARRGTPVATISPIPATPGDIRCRPSDRGRVLRPATYPLTSLTASFHKITSRGPPTPGIFVGTLPHVRGDRARITQVLDNLIGNALKYTPPGQPAHLDITAHLTPARPGSESQIHVQVADRGIGVPAGQHTAIFTSFHRAHTTGPYDGTGLGLAICHRIVERHGGDIYATDNPGGGTRARQVPLARPFASPPALRRMRRAAPRRPSARS